MFGQDAGLSGCQVDLPFKELPLVFFFSLFEILNTNYTHTHTFLHFYNTVVTDEHTIFIFQGCWSCDRTKFPVLFIRFLFHPPRSSRQCMWHSYFFSKIVRIFIILWSSLGWRKMTKSPHSQANYLSSIAVIWFPGRRTRNSQYYGVYFYSKIIRLLFTQLSKK